MRIPQFFSYLDLNNTNCLITPFLRVKKMISSPIFLFMTGLIALYLLNFNYLNIFWIIDLDKIELFFTNSNWFEDLKLKAFQLYIITVFVKEDSVIFTFTAEQRQHFLALFSVLFNNSITLEEFKLFFEEFQKFEKLFNNIFFDSTFFIKANQHLLNYWLFDPLGNNYYDAVVGFTLTNIAKSSFDAPLMIHQTQLEDFFVFQLFFISVATYFFKKKILLFYFFNGLTIGLMFWTLAWLATALNLIYALLHFLLFAVLSGLLIIFWGATYIGFCVLLIYGAAIPVLALYIIMLVNVDLIQWLFFIEHQLSTSIYDKIKRFSIFIFIFFFFFSAVRHINFSTNSPMDNLLDEFSDNIFYLLLAKWYISTLTFSYGTGSAYDLPLSFYFSDIDKVASAAFKISANELLALVFLLLIAIIVVISISRPNKNLLSSFHEIPEIPEYYTKKFLQYSNKKSFYKIFFIYLTNWFLSLRWIYMAFGGWKNYEHTPIYIYTWKFWLVDYPDSDSEYLLRQTLDPYQQANPEDLWLDWYLLYRYDDFYTELLQRPNIIKYQIYGAYNPTSEDAIFEQLNKGLID